MSESRYSLRSTSIERPVTVQRQSRSKSKKRKESPLVSGDTNLEQLFDIDQQLAEEEKDIKMASKEEVETIFKAHQIPRKIFYPKDFSGKSTENAREFLSQFQDYCMMHDLKEPEKLLTLKLLLSGTAKVWWLGLSPETQSKYDAVEKAFKENYLQSNEWINSARLDSTKMLPNQSAEDFISHMSSLALLTGASDEELRKSILRGLNDKLRWQVINFNPKTLTETIQRILISEASSKASQEDRQIVNAISDTAVNMLAEKIEKLDESFKASQMDSQYQQPIDMRQPRQDIARQFPGNCRHCGKYGHKIADCRSLPQNQMRGNRQFQQPRYPAYNVGYNQPAVRGQQYGQNMYQGGQNNPFFWPRPNYPRHQRAQGWYQNANNYNNGPKNDGNPRV